MKKFRKVFALVAAAVMVMAFSFAAFAANQDSGKGGDASITITLPTEKTAPTAKTTYSIYKVFDATNDGETAAISYTVKSGKSGVPNINTFIADKNGTVYHFSGTYANKGDAGAIAITVGNETKYIVPTGGELTSAEVTAIANYVVDTDRVYIAEVNAGETSVTVTGLEYGYYYITTSSGTVVTVDSTNPSADVNDKNILPIVKKSAGTEYNEASLKAIAAVGTSQDYTAQINVGKGTKSLVFTDTMTNQTYNGDAKVTVNGQEVTAGANTFSVSGVVGDSTFTISFVDAYIAKLAENTIITINYSGKITSDALSKDPATNTATITSGDKDNTSSKSVEVYNAKVTVYKQDGKEVKLPGAGFVIKNAEGKYYKLANDKKSISWEDGEAQATEYISGTDGYTTAFTGLGAGTYTLVEKTVPEGYNQADDISFEITDDDFTASNLEKIATVSNFAGAELPSTGGIGTTIFYIIGSILVIGAGVLLVTKKRMDS